MNNPDWPKFLQGLRDAGMKAYAAAQSKSQDQIRRRGHHDHGLREPPRQREKPTLADRRK
jgi:hypothetical protein